MSRRAVLGALAGLLVLTGACSARVSARTPGPAAPPSDSAAPIPVRALPKVLRSGIYVARADSPTFTVDKHPSTKADVSWRFPSTNSFGQQVAFLVTGASRASDGSRWLRLLLGSSPNGASAWAPADEVKVTQLHDRIVVDLSKRTLTRYHDGRPIQRFRVGVGQPQWPTTPGHFFVWAKVPQPSPAGPYGAYALGLSGFSRVLTGWPGGGRMAIHGTANPADQGQMVSHGCVRVYNPEMLKLSNVPMGTPVTIQK